MKSSTALKARNWLSAGIGAKDSDLKTMVLLSFALLCLTAPFDLSQLTFAILGAIFYASLMLVQKGFGKKGPKVCSKMPREQKQNPVQETSRNYNPQVHKNASNKGPVKMESMVPVPRLVLSATGWDAEVDELVSQLLPTPETEQAVQQVAAQMKTALGELFSEVDVLGFACGNVGRSRAFGVAVPDVDMVVNILPDSISLKLQHKHHRLPKDVSAESWKMQKSLLRACTDHLVTKGNFKFRRSAFRSQHPKVTLLASGDCASKSGFPIDIYINSLMPMYNAALITECAQLDPRARALILLVRRWAKDRGVCHSAKVHLCPYLWTLLTIYFLQVGAGDEGPLLPPLAMFQMSSSLRQKSDDADSGSPLAKWQRATVDGMKAKTVGQLFREFVLFYQNSFDWHKEVVSVRNANRAALSEKLGLHEVSSADGTCTDVAPTIEDPFEDNGNLSSSMTAGSVERLRFELSRAEQILNGASHLADLLEPWTPPDAHSSDD